LFPVRFEIVSVLQAIAFIGSDMVGALVATTCLKSLAAGRSSPFIVACWRHNLATALVCQRLSEAMGVPESNGYTAGLVHDIGQLALLTVFPDYEKALASAGEREIHPLDVERELFGLDHAEAGRWLLAEWNCPLELQNVAARHENPPQAPARDGALIRLVQATFCTNRGAANSGCSRLLAGSRLAWKTRHASKEPPKKAAAGKIARPTSMETGRCDHAGQSRERCHRVHGRESD
jgi:HD-like signal output (HDOD) protein